VSVFVFVLSGRQFPSRKCKQTEHRKNIKKLPPHAYNEQISSSKNICIYTDVASIRSTLGCPLTGAATHASCSLAAQDTDTRSSRYDYLGSKQRRLLLARLDAWMVGWMDGWVQGPSARFSALGQPQMTQNRRQGRGFTHAHSHSGRNLLTR